MQAGKHTDRRANGRTDRYWELIVNFRNLMAILYSTEELGIPVKEGKIR